MNNVTLAGRTVHVSEELKEGKNTVTYVRLAVKGNKKNKKGEPIDDFFEIKFFNGQSEFAQKFLNLKDPIKIKNNAKNPIYSRIISVSGKLSKWTEKKVAKSGEVFYLDHYNIVVNNFTLLDPMPEFAKEKLAISNSNSEGDISSSLIQKIKEELMKELNLTPSSEKVTVPEDIETKSFASTQGTTIDGEDIPM